MRQGTQARTTVDPFSFYWAESIQLEADHFSVGRILDFLEAAPVGKEPKALQVMLPVEEEFVEFRLFGWCPDPDHEGEKVGCEFAVTLEADEVADAVKRLAPDEKRRVMEVIARHYPGYRGPHLALKVRVAKVLGVRYP